MTVTLKFDNPHGYGTEISSSAIGLEAAESNASGETPSFVSGARIQTNPNDDAADLIIKLDIGSSEMSSTSKQEIVNALQNHLGPEVALR